ncbi:hypothetical protein OIDMADRAFT_86528, partial [Oidiodendron maius Zn]
MNNDPTPPPAEDNLPRVSTPENASGSESAPTTAAAAEQDEVSPAQSRALKRAEAQFEKKLEFINSLMKSLDVLIYMELCILYYMDCSLFYFLLRVIPQMTFLTPKPNVSPPLLVNYFGAIYVPTILCILLHILTARPEAGEAMRGYLHGGVIIDLIGYKGPTSKLHLLCLDLLVFALQCLMLTVQVELKMVKMILAVVRSNPVSGSQPGVQVVSAQDHDAEEQGIVREGILNTGDIEMRALSPRVDGPSSHDGTETGGDHDHQQLLEDSPPQNDADQDNILDAMWSGSAIIADFHVISTIQR